MSNKQLNKKSQRHQVTQFIDQVRKTPLAPTAAAVRGRLLFALDATASRQATWDHACQLQADMFTTTARLGTLAIQLVWYRGIGQFQCTPWTTTTEALLQQMSGVHCAGGLTQVGRVLNHAIQESRQHKINALVLVSDAMEEPPEPLLGLAGQLGLLGVPVFIFQEGNDAVARQTYQQIARLSHGAYSRFDHHSAEQLRQLLTAVAVYATGGKSALQQLRLPAGDQLLLQLER